MNGRERIEAVLRNAHHIRMISRRLMLTVALSAGVCGPALSDVSDAQREEVAHLLGFLRTTTCTVERNAKRHDGENAYSHVQKKYDYFRDDIKTTEEFIEYSATKSTMSGKYYMVLCEGQAPVRTQDWLLRELDTYREKHKE